MILVVDAKNKDRKRAAVAYTFPATGSDALSTLGDSFVHEAVIAHIKTKLQTAIRAALDKGESADSISERLQSWSPAPKPIAGVAPLLKKASELSDEARAILIAELQAL